jgi:predicted nucleic acid-binding protein
LPAPRKGAWRAQAADRLVPDASVAFKWHIADEPDTVRAVAVLAAYTAGDLALVAPDHFRYEVPAALRAATRRRPPRLSREQADQAVAEFLGFAIPTVTDDALVTDALAVSFSNDCGFYDALYVALAHRLGIPFLTADAKLYQQVRQLPDVLWLGDWQTGSSEAV